MQTYKEPQHTTYRSAGITALEPPPLAVWPWRSPQLTRASLFSAWSKNQMFIRPSPESRFSRLENLRCLCICPGHVKPPGHNPGLGLATQGMMWSTRNLHAVLGLLTSHRRDATPDLSRAQIFITFSQVQLCVHQEEGSVNSVTP